MRRQSSLKLDKHNTPLADINELSTALRLATLLNLPDSINTLTREYGEAWGRAETRISNLTRSKGDDLRSAMIIKAEQGEAIANELVNDRGIVTGATDVIWSNTADRFKNATGEDKDPDTNPSDFVILYNEITPVIFGENRKWFGVSLKASFKGNEVGQYNSSSCSFIAGVIYSENNNKIKELCKKGKKGKKGKYSHMQDEVNTIYEIFKERWCSAHIKDWVYGARSALNKAAWENTIAKKGGRTGSFGNAASAARIVMYSKCIHQIYSYLLGDGVDGEKKETLEGKQVVISADVSDAETSIASYLRINKDDIGKSPNYIKASALGNNVILELPGIYTYLPANYKIMAKVPMVFTKTNPDTLNLSCGGLKSIDFRLKLAGVPPAAIKINGQNNLYVITPGDEEGEEKAGKAYRSSTAAGKEPGFTNMEMSQYTAFVHAAINLYINRRNDQYVDEGSPEYITLLEQLITDNNIKNAITEYKNVLSKIGGKDARDGRFVFRQGGYWEGLNETTTKIIENITHEQKIERLSLLRLQQEGKDEEDDDQEVRRPEGKTNTSICRSLITWATGYGKDPCSKKKEKD